MSGEPEAFSQEVDRRGWRALAFLCIFGNKIPLLPAQLSRYTIEHASHGTIMMGNDLWVAIWYDLVCASKGAQTRHQTER